MGDIGSDAYRTLCTTFDAKTHEDAEAYYVAALRPMTRATVARAVRWSDLRFSQVPSAVVFASFCRDCVRETYDAADPHLRSLPPGHPYERLARHLERYALSRKVTWPAAAKAEYDAIVAACALHGGHVAFTPGGNHGG